MRKLPKRYRDKVQARLDAAKKFLRDRKSFESLMKRRNGGGHGSEFPNQMSWFWKLLDEDVPALLAAFDEEVDSDAGDTDFNLRSEAPYSA